MESNCFQELLNCIKLLEQKTIQFPDVGKQRKYRLYCISDKNEKFELIINRKGHLNQQNLTYQLMSHTLKGVLVRLDCNGAPHDDVDTPHVHIFDEEHDYGRIAIGLGDLEVNLANELLDSLIYFLDYTNVNYANVAIPLL